MYVKWLNGSSLAAYVHMYVHTYIVSADVFYFSLIINVLQRTLDDVSLHDQVIW